MKTNLSSHGAAAGDACATSSSACQPRGPFNGSHPPPALAGPCSQPGGCPGPAHPAPWVIHFTAPTPPALQDVDWGHQPPQGIQPPLEPWPPVRAEIYLGLGLTQATAVSEATWRAFVLEVVVTEFPCGFAIFDGTGAYQGLTEPCRKIEVIILGKGAWGRLERVAAAWLQRAQQASVLAVVTPIHGGAL